LLSRAHLRGLEAKQDREPSMRPVVEDQPPKRSDGISSLSPTLGVIKTSLFMLMVRLWPAILKILRSIYPGKWTALPLQHLRR
jgi:hypothetical protein